MDKAFADEPKQFVTRKARSGEEKEVRDETTGQPKETEEYKAWRAVVKVTDSYFAGDYLQLCLDTRVQERSLAETPDAFNASLDEELQGDGGGAAIATTAAKGGADGGGQGGPLSLSSSSVAVAVECHPAVKANYHRAFKALVGQAPAISLPEHGLTDGGLRPFLAHVKGHGECPGLRTLDLRGNHRLTWRCPSSATRSGCRCCARSTSRAAAFRATSRPERPAPPGAAAPERQQVRVRPRRRSFDAHGPEGAPFVRSL